MIDVEIATDPVGAVARVAEDLQPPLDGEPAAERVGDVAEAVLVERAGDQQADGDGDSRSDERRHASATAARRRRRRAPR